MQSTYRKIYRVWKRHRSQKTMDVERAEARLLELERNHEEWGRSLDVGRIAIWDYDLEADVFHRSVVHDQLYGFYYPLHHWNFKKFMSLILEEDRPAVLRCFQQAFEGKIANFNVEYRIMRPDRKILWLEVRARCHEFKLGKPKFIRGAVVDITRLKEIELAQRDAILERDEFLGVASHELRNPLRILDFHLQLLKSDLRKSFNANEALASVEACLRQTSSLQRLVKDFLDVSRITNGQLRVECVDFDAAAFVQSIARDLEIQGIKLNLNIGEGLRVWGDPVRLEQVLLNLLMNAARYSESHPIDLSIQYRRTGTLFFVRDHGCGIKAEDQKKLFERFQRGKERSLDGMGLGLFISKHIVEAHGGRIWCESVEGNGSTFYFEIPLCSPKKSSS